MLVQLLLLSLLSLSSAFKPSSSSASIVPGRYIIEIDPASTIPGPHKRDSTTPDLLLNSVLGHIQSTLGSNVEVKHAYNTHPALFLGASVQVHGTEHSVAGLAALPHVLNVWPVRRVRRPQPVSVARPKDAGESASPSSPVTAKKFSNPILSTNSSPADTFAPHVMTQVNTLHGQGIFGAGVKIGIIDSGVDWTHPYLGGCFGPGCRISFGKDFVGSAYTGSNTPVPGDNPLDNCNGVGDGHGTHVTGIITALPNPYGFTGVAPAATVGMYRIFGCLGDVTTDIIVAALIQGSADRCQILTLSLGGADGWSGSGADAVLIDRLESQGITVTVAAGNDGQTGAVSDWPLSVVIPTLTSDLIGRTAGLFYASEPANSLNGIGVGSVDATSLIAYNAQVSNSSPVPYLSVKSLNISANLGVYFTSLDPTIVDDACSPLPDATPDLSNKVVIIQRGTCTFVTKFQNALAKGGKVILIYDKPNNSEDIYLDTPTGVTAVAWLRRQDGLNLLNLYKGNNALTMSFPMSPVISSIPSQTGGLQSYYSTFGPTFDMFADAALSGPGGNILSTVPLALGGVAVYSGTSMATPFIAAATALLMSARSADNLSTRQLKALLMTTAAPVSVNLGGGAPYTTVVRQGSGLVQALQAVNARTIITPSQLFLNDTKYPSGKHTVTIRNTYKFTMKYKFSSFAGQGVGVFDKAGNVLPSTSPPYIAAANGVVTFDKSSVTVAAGGTAAVVVTIAPPVLSASDSGRFPVYSGWISFKGVGSGKGKGTKDSYLVSYFGMANAMFNLPIFDTTSNNYGSGAAYPFLADGNGNVQTSSMSYPANAGPLIYFRLAAGSSLVSIDVVPGNTTFTGTISTNDNSIARRHLLQRRGTLHNAITPSRKATRQLYSSISLAGNAFSETYSPRDGLSSSGSYQYSDESLQVSATTSTPPLVIGTTYRLLLRFVNPVPCLSRVSVVDATSFTSRALKITGNPLYEDQYESWVSPPFSFHS